MSGCHARPLAGVLPRRGLHRPTPGAVALRTTGGKPPVDVGPSRRTVTRLPPLPPAPPPRYASRHVVVDSRGGGVSPPLPAPPPPTPPFMFPRGLQRAPALAAGAQQRRRRRRGPAWLWSGWGAEGAGVLPVCHPPPLSRVQAQAQRGGAVLVPPCPVEHPTCAAAAAGGTAGVVVGAAA